MHTLKKIGAGLAASLVSILLFNFGLVWSVYQGFGSPDSVKNALEQSRIYDNVVSQALAALPSPEEQGRMEGEGGSDGLQVSDPAVQKIIKDAIPPEFLKTQTAAVIDNFYAWARGEAEQLQFTIDLTDAKARLADGLAMYATERMASLPECASPINPDEFDPLSASCKPPGTDSSAVEDMARKEITGGEFLKNPVITADSIKNDKGQTLPEQLKNVPGVFDLAKLILWVSSVGAVLFGLALVFLSPSWRQGLKRLGIIMLAVGLVSAAFAFIAWWGTGRISSNFTQSNPGEIQTTLASLAHHLTANMSAWWLGYSAALAIIGLSVIIALRLARPQAQDRPSHTNPAKPKEPPVAAQNPPALTNDPGSPLRPEPKTPPTPKHP